MKLIICAGKDKENWGQIAALINRMEDCEKVFIVKDKSIEEFHIGEKCEEIIIDLSMPLIELKQCLLNKFREKLKEDFEVALSLASGSGKEHMAIISALINAPVGIKLVVYTGKGIEFLS